MRASPSASYSACGRVHVDVGADDVEQRERAHRPAGAEAHRLVEVLDVMPASSRTRTQSFSSGIRIRLTMKPGVSLQRTGFLPRRSSKREGASSTVASVVRSARTISTSGISGAGLKKCMPTTRSGRPLAAATSVTESAEVFVARIAVCAGHSSPSSRNSSCLTLEVLEDRLDHEVDVGAGPRSRSS